MENGLLSLELQSLLFGTFETNKLIFQGDSLTVRSGTEQIKARFHEISNALNSPINNDVRISTSNKFISWSPPSESGIMHGLQLARAHNYNSIVIESDSTAALNFVKHGCPSTHPCFPGLCWKISTTWFVTSRISTGFIY
ncbi:hypothetical protein PIB30_027563 [Stylosanthes scabra]|uniref:RNase H type-1 domain-containing protein n=1 Tax=Stylosanthes scabra TaxID=79078 RepID=A0ABU6VAI5_9FABA|nr:hypothetical protein [Stylosanthes scabra]